MWRRLVKRPQPTTREGIWIGGGVRWVETLSSTTQAPQSTHDKGRPQRRQRTPRTIHVKPVKVVTAAESAQADRARRVLRAILRECTYLPDEFARRWITQHVLARFRTYGFKVWKHRDDESFQERIEGKEREARQGLSQLKRANEGERKCLLKVLLLSYGRIGKRRHELMVPLLPAKGTRARKKALQTQANSEEAIDNVADVLEREDSGETSNQDAASVSVSVTANEANAPSTAIGKSATLELTPLRALLRSQIHASPPDLTRPNPRRLDPDIPKLNAWLRPTPQNRIRNMKQKHYALLLDRVLPPLPIEEWNRLRDLASGKTRPSVPAPRRKASVSSSNAYAGVDVLPRSPLEMVVMHGKVPERVFGNRNAHAITPRFMQRLYAQVFCQCPHMKWNNDKKEWKVTWGERALHAPQTAMMNSNSALSDSNGGEVLLEDAEASSPPGTAVSG